MAQYDVYRLSPGSGLVVDVQSDLLEPLNTRVVVPLLAEADAPTPARRLNPVLEVDGERMVLVTQFLAAVRRVELGQPLASLEADRDRITAALDMVFQGV